jgi:hypothetical protein
VCTETDGSQRNTVVESTAPCTEYVWPNLKNDSEVPVFLETGVLL